MRTAIGICISERDRNSAQRRLLAYSRITKSGCQEWTKATDKKGYGRIGLAFKNLKAPRVSYLVFKGEIPDGLCVLHKCDNRKCVNPSHLYIGSHQDNMRDRADRGRTQRLKGVEKPTAKLTEADIFQIFAERRTGKKMSDIAEMFGVDPSRISAILGRKVWRHITERIDNE